MDKKESLRKKIDRFGVKEVSKILKMSVSQLLMYCDYPINSPDLIYQVIMDFFEEVTHKPGGYYTYKEYSISYDRYEGLVVWDDEEFVTRHGGGPSFEYYATPFYNEQSGIPITLASVFDDDFDNGGRMDLTDIVGSDWYVYIDVDYTKLNSVEKIRNWLETEYLELTYHKINKLRDNIIEYNNLI